MEIRPCGRSGLRLSVLGLGCWKFGGGDYWGPVDQATVDAAVRRAVDLGITYFDTAEVYNDGRSETALGIALKGIPRDRVVIGTKIAPSNTEPETLRAHCEASLRRLQTETIDLYMVHWPITPAGIAHYTVEPILPSVADAFATLLQLQAEGKIRHIGVSNFGVTRMKEAFGTGAAIAVNQLPYSLLSRAIEAEILPFCREAGVGVIAYMALQQGLLTGAYSRLAEIPPIQGRTRHFDNRRAGSLARHGEAGAEPETEEAMRRMRDLAGEIGMSMADLAIRYAAARDGITSVIVGSGSPKHLERNAEALARPLDPSVFERLDAITLPVWEKLGSSFDYFENPANDRTR